METDGFAMVLGTLGQKILVHACFGKVGGRGRGGTAYFQVSKGTFFLCPWHNEKNLKLSEKVFCLSNLSL